MLTIICITFGRGCRLLSLIFVFKLGPVPVGCGTAQSAGQLCQDSTKSWTLLQGARKQSRDYTGDVPVSGVYSISCTNPLPKSSLSRDGQIIQLSEVSGTVRASRLFRSLGLQRLWYSFRNPGCAPLCRSPCAGPRFPSSFSALGETQDFPVPIKEN